MGYYRQSERESGDRLVAVACTGLNWSMPDAEIDSSGGARGSILQLKARLLDISPMV